MENKQLLSKTFLSNMASYYKVGFSCFAASTPSIDQNVTRHLLTKMWIYCPGIVRFTYLFYSKSSNTLFETTFNLNFIKIRQSVQLKL